MAGYAVYWYLTTYDTVDWNGIDNRLLKQKLEEAGLLKVKSEENTLEI